MNSKITIDNKTIEVVGKNNNLLIYLEEQGMPVKFGCLMGVCGICKLKVLKGQENIVMSNDHIIELKKDEILLCCSKLNGDATLTSK
jgi:ferredoxin